jgi:hypothetical protein
MNRYFHFILPVVVLGRNPFDVLKTLSQTNQGKSIPLTTLVGQMYHDQGIKGFYRGVNVNVMRACVLNATKMGVYDIAKGKVVDSTGWTRKDPRTAFCSSFVAGFFMTCTVVRSIVLRLFVCEASSWMRSVLTGWCLCIIVVSLLVVILLLLGPIR